MYDPSWNGVAVARVAGVGFIADGDFDLAIDDITHLVVLVTVGLHNCVFEKQEFAEHGFIGRGHRPAMEPLPHFNLFGIGGFYKIAI